MKTKHQLPILDIEFWNILMCVLLSNTGGVTHWFLLI